MQKRLQNLIITAASESYKAQLIAFLASLRCNWPDHPPVRIYDMGLSPASLALLGRAGFEVHTIPPFVSHWRKHYTWKPWCMADAAPAAERILWIDAGCCILRPLPEIFEIIGQQGYFALPNYRPLDIEASDAACEGCGVPGNFRSGKVSLTAAVFGFRHGSTAEQVVHEALAVARTERYIKATESWHRWEQAILSLLMYRAISPLVLCDGTLYFYESLKANVTVHSIWAARRSMHYRDKALLAMRLIEPALPFRPRPSHKTTLWYQAARQPKVGFFALLRLLGIREKTPNGIK